MIGHFHTHTHYSILDGAMTVDNLLEKAHKGKIDAIALTEHGNIFSAVEFFLKAKERGVKPIIGCEMYIAPGRIDAKKSENEESNYHATVLVKNEAGYKNLCMLLKIANTEGFYRKPRIDFNTLYEYREGLIMLSGCLNGIIPRLILQGKIDEAYEKAAEFKKIFGDDFYLEIMRGEAADPNREEDILTVAKQKKVNEYLLDFSKKLGIPAVATGDCHYAEPNDYELQDMLVAIGHGEKIDNQRKFRYRIKGLYVKSKEQMIETFRDIPQTLETHEDIIKKCNFEFKKSKELRIPNPYNQNPDEVLRTKAYEGLRKLLEKKKLKKMNFNEEEYYKRLETEISVISKKNFSSYFLVVEDFITEAKRRGIPVGPGRGSAAGSIVSWALGITELDPIQYGLIFERFLNPEREKIPDIDVDFCKARRDEVLEYVSEKYGKDSVCHIITFGTFGARTAIRDVGRILDEPPEHVSYLAELVPQEPSRKWTLDDAYNEIQEFRNAVESNPKFRKIFEKAKRLEGLIRHVGSHASGFLISDKPITEYTSVHRSKDGLTTQFEMENLEKIGLVKFDFLGLETLTVIQKTFDLIKQKYGIELSYDNIPLDDRKTYEMIKKGDTFGVFQFESSGMRDMLMKLEPSEFKDLIAAVALYRPGPIQSGMVSDYVERKKGIKPVTYPHPSLEPILKETYGNFLYQEQIMFTANILAGFTMSEADILREAMGKKKADLMASMRERFISGCISNGIDKSLAEEIFDIMEKFSGYAFNKSHSACYAFISYITGYLKANYPLEYISSILSSEIGNQEKLVKYLENVIALGYKILPPSITKSKFEFTVEGDAIRFGLGGIKGFGESAAKLIEEIREKLNITSFDGFINHAQRIGINKKVLELLAKAGAFDELIDRKKAIQKIEAFLKGKGSSLFANEKENEITDRKLEEYEIETIGIVLSKNNIFDKLKENQENELEILPIRRKEIIEISGIVRKIIPTKSGKLLNIQVSEKKKYTVMILNSNSDKIREGEIYVFIGRNSGNMIVSKVFFKPQKDYILLAKTNIVEEDSIRKTIDIISKQEDGLTKIILEINGKSYWLKKKVKLTKQLKENLEKAGLSLLLIPSSLKATM
ncbi:MAG: DNA polymerase III subunit alpha [Candidatus Calescibacterium sp.]|nr:DNA polymerase III subunit alpha [Candidatus Calescibacterium sp.]MDW8087781.1 DNA polymerase III subunit alpha [Candidatus Calescibacterium sp.]